MRKLYFILLAALASLPVFSQFDFYATAIYLSANGNTSFYNTTTPGNDQTIGAITFHGASLGSFAQNSGALTVAGAEIKTFKSANGNVCSGTVFFTVYPVGQRPASPVYTSIGLGFYSNCADPACGSFPNAFPLAKGGGCCNPLDQKWQFPGGGNGGGNDGNIDLTARAPGDYILEVYYQVTGQENGNGCTQSKYDNNASAPANYTASFTISAVLPIHFGNIAAFQIQNTNRINWSTYSEQNSKLFSVERAADGKEFKTIGNIPAAGNSASEKQYFFIDSKPLEGINYYRVKMVENNGKTYYSQVATATIADYGTISLYPNPAKNKLTIYSLSTGNTIKIYNAAGAIMYSAFSPGQSYIADLSRLLPGRYQVQVVNAARTTSLPLIIAR